MYIAVAFCLPRQSSNECLFNLSTIGLFVRTVGIQSNENVLDLGTRTGWVTVEIRRYITGRIVGIDVSPKMVAEAWT
jgi:predicted TPR repeat methyltransferase